MGMTKIEVRSNWGYFDALEGRDLRPGECLRIEWPDGSTTEETIGVEDHGYESSREGHISSMKAYVKVLVRGAPAKVWLREIQTLRAERI